MRGVQGAIMRTLAVMGRLPRWAGRGWGVRGLQGAWQGGQ